jgi:hypothetical protein
MDYLVYVEQCAEPLQFFLWYCDYIERWRDLTPEQKAMTPKWDFDSQRPVTPTSPTIPVPPTNTHSRQTSDASAKKFTINVAIGDDEIAENENKSKSLSRSNSSKLNFSLPRAATASGEADDTAEPCKFCLVKICYLDRFKLIRY